MNQRAIVVCDQWLGSNGYAGLKALRRAEWAVQSIPEWEFIPLKWESFLMRAAGRALRPWAVREFNAALVEEARRLLPEFLLVFKGTFIQRATLNALRRQEVKTYCFYPDVSFRVHGRYIPSALPAYDWIFTTKEFGLTDLREQLGITRASVLLHAYDSDLHRPIRLSGDDVARYSCDVSFIGTWSRKKEALLTGLMERRPQLRLRIWGIQWRKVRSSSILSPAVAGYDVTGDEYVKAIRASRINLGLLSERRTGASEGDSITSRTFHIPASMGFMLHERTDAVQQIFVENESVVCFADAEELAEQVGRWLHDDVRRQYVLERGRQVVSQHHSWDHRIQDILRVHRERRGEPGVKMDIR